MPGVGAAREGQDLHRQPRPLRHYQQVLELRAHHRGAADRPPDHRLVEDRPQLERRIVVESALALDPQVDAGDGGHTLEMPGKSAHLQQRCRHQTVPSSPCGR